MSKRGLSPPVSDASPNLKNGYKKGVMEITPGLTCFNIAYA